MPINNDLKHKDDCIKYFRVRLLFLMKNAFFFWKLEEALAADSTDFFKYHVSFTLQFLAIAFEQSAYHLKNRVMYMLLYFCYPKKKTHYLAYKDRLWPHRMTKTHVTFINAASISIYMNIWRFLNQNHLEVLSTH